MDLMFMPATLAANQVAAAVDQLAATNNVNAQWLLAHIDAMDVEEAVIAV
jgi:hypothetical protein